VNFKNACLAVAIIVTGNGCASHVSATTVALSSQDYILDIYLPDEQWKPTEKEAAEAKTALFAYVTSGTLPAGEPPGSFTATYRPTVAAQLGSYSLQYFGGHYLWTDGHMQPNASGEKEILINGLCKGPWLKTLDVAKQLIEVNDGGACFFHALYNPAQRKILEFSINGGR